MNDTQLKFEKMEMRFNYKEKEVWINTETLPTWTNFNTKDQHIHTHNPVDGLLFDFIKADFHTWKGFLDFVDKWGISGLIDISNQPLPTENEPWDIQKMEPMDFFRVLYQSTSPNLIHAQEHFKKVIDFCLNAENNPYLDKLTPLQRYYLGCEMGLIESLNEYSKNYTMHYKPEQEFYEFIGLIPSQSLEELSQALQDKDITITKIYTSGDLRTLAYLQLFDLIEDFKVRVCANCSGYFTPAKKVNEKYCSKCSDIGYTNKVNNDPLLREYNRAYKRIYAQKERAKVGKSDTTIAALEAAFQKWQKVAQEKMALTQNGDMNEDDYFNFLKIRLEV